MKIRSLPLYRSHDTAAQEPDRVAASELPPSHINPFEWDQAIGLARQVCARIFRDGGTPAQALSAFGLPPRPDADWHRAVDLVAEAMITPASSKRKAA